MIYLDPEITLAAASVTLTLSDVCATYRTPKSAFYKPIEDIWTGPHNCNGVFEG